MDSRSCDQWATGYRRRASDGVRIMCVGRRSGKQRAVGIRECGCVGKANEVIEASSVSEVA